jgi:hypothetical protein
MRTQLCNKLTQILLVEKVGQIHIIERSTNLDGDETKPREFLEGQAGLVRKRLVHGTVVIVLVLPEFSLGIRNDTEIESVTAHVPYSDSLFFR